MNTASGRLAYAYDRTHYHPPEVSGRIASAITLPVERRFPDPHFLEIGVGTGRIGVPVLARGYRFTGLDRDPAMLEVFRYKIAGVGRKVRIVEGDAAALPFEKDSFHAVISVQVWHHLEDWRRALLEVIRVLVPGGYLFEGWEVSEGESEDCRIQKQWAAFLEELGYPLERGLQQRVLAQVEKALQKLGLKPEVRVVAEWEEARTPRQSFEALAERTYRFARQVPEEVFAPSIERLARWLVETYPDLDAPQPIRRRFYLRTTEL